jgi:hypothetical protein
LEGEPRGAPAGYGRGHFAAQAAGRGGETAENLRGLERFNGEGRRHDYQELRGVGGGNDVDDEQAPQKIIVAFAAENEPQCVGYLPAELQRFSVGTARKGFIAAAIDSGCTKASAGPPSLSPST